jgi:hypothetical protein
MLMKEYTWYVNCLGHVQVYEGNIDTFQIEEAYSLEDAMKDNTIVTPHYKQIFKKKYKGLRGMFNHEMYATWEFTHNTYEHRPQMKYWIPQEYVKAFFILIDDCGTYGDSGVTTVDVSKFLD